MSNERFSFEEACRELSVSEEELESLVAAGEIASLKEGDTVYFKRDVVRKFKKQRESEPTILLTDDELNLLEDPVEEINLLVEDEGTPPARPAGKAGLAKARAAASDEGLPEIDLDADDSPQDLKVEVTVKSGKTKEPEGDETLLNLDGLLEEDSEATTPVPGGGDDATLLDTDLLDLSGEADPFSADTAEETSATDLTEAGTLLRSGGARVMQMKRKSSHAVWTVLLAVAGLFLVLPLGVLTNMIFTSSPESKTGVPPQDAYQWVKDTNLLHGVVERAAEMFRPQ